MVALEHPVVPQALAQPVVKVRPTTDSDPRLQLVISTSVRRVVEVAVLTERRAVAEAAAQAVRSTASFVRAHARSKRRSK